MSEKSQWGSKLGFILASAGSAIGLGAVWKFPYMTAANGGGGFLLVFLISTILIGFQSPHAIRCPLLISFYRLYFQKGSGYEELHLDQTPWKQELFQVWLFLLRFIIPIIIIVVFIAQLM